MKLDCDTVGMGSFPPPGYQDHIALNRWTKALKPNVPGRIEAALRPTHAVGRQSKLGHIARSMTPRRFYVQLNMDDLHMLVVPP